MTVLIVATGDSHQGHGLVLHHGRRARRPPPGSRRRRPRARPSRSGGPAHRSTCRRVSPSTTWVTVSCGAGVVGGAVTDALVVGVTVVDAIVVDASVTGASVTGASAVATSLSGGAAGSVSSAPDLGRLPNPTRDKTATPTTTPTLPLRLRPPHRCRSRPCEAWGLPVTRSRARFRHGRARTHPSRSPGPAQPRTPARHPNHQRSQRRWRSEHSHPNSSDHTTSRPTAAADHRPPPRKPLPPRQQPQQPTAS